MERVVVWIRRGLTVVVVILLLVLAAYEWGIQSNAAIFGTGLYLDTEETAAVQQRWLCAAAVGPDCIILDWLNTRQ